MGKSEKGKIGVEFLWLVRLDEIKLIGSRIEAEQILLKVISKRHTQVIRFRFLNADQKLYEWTIFNKTTNNVIIYVLTPQNTPQNHPRQQSSKSPKQSSSTSPNHTTPYPISNSQ